MCEDLSKVKYSNLKLWLLFNNFFNYLINYTIIYNMQLMYYV